MPQPLTYICPFASGLWWPCSYSVMHATHLVPMCTAQTPPDGCTYTVDGVTKRYRPGSVLNQYDSQMETCTPCYCYFDNWRCNTTVNLPKRYCGIRDIPPRNCTYRNADGEMETLPHGMRKRARCNNTCGCSDGQLVCTSVRCNDDDNDDECGRCDSQQVFSPVCGNGREYKSRCHAMQCGNLTAREFTDGRCTVSAQGTGRAMFFIQIIMFLFCTNCVVKSFHLGKHHLIKFLLYNICLDVVLCNFSPS